MGAKKPPILFEGKVRIKSGDTVQIISGKDKGQAGKVTAVYPKTGKLVVEGLNIATKHQKGQPTQANPNPEGGRIKVAAPIAISKVALVNGEGKPTRVRIAQNADGTKARIAVTGGAAIPEPAK